MEDLYVIDLIKRSSQELLKKEEISRMIRWGFSNNDLSAMENLYMTG